jgi:hypothetical protein
LYVRGKVGCYQIHTKLRQHANLGWDRSSEVIAKDVDKDLHISISSSKLEGDENTYIRAMCIEQEAANALTKVC